MTVFVLLADYEYEGQRCLGVYATREEAERAYQGVLTGAACLIEERVLGAPGAFFG